VCNLALMVGDRFFGWRGAAAALAGLLVLPLALVLGATALYAQFALVPAVAGALRGMNAVAAGLVIAAALKLMPSLRGSALRISECVLFGAAMFAAVQWLQWPLIWALAGVGTLSCATAWRRLGASPSAEKR
jgi:chromate transporter